MRPASERAALRARARALRAQAEFLIVGVQGAKPRIYRINEAGKFTAPDSDYTIIGDPERSSWSALAMLGVFGRLPLTHAVYRALEAKRVGESSVRVGRNTDMAILDPAGVRLLDEPFIRFMEELYDARQGTRFPQSALKRIERDIARLAVGLVVAPVIKRLGIGGEGCLETGSPD